MWHRTEDVTNDVNRDKPAQFCPELFKSVERDNCCICSLSLQTLSVILPSPRTARWYRHKPTQTWASPTCSGSLPRPENSKWASRSWVSFLKVRIAQAHQTGIVCLMLCLPLLFRFSRLYMMNRIFNENNQITENPWAFCDFKLSPFFSSFSVPVSPGVGPLTSRTPTACLLSSLLCRPFFRSAHIKHRTSLEPKELRGRGVRGPLPHLLEQCRNSKRMWEPRNLSTGMGSFSSSDHRGLLLW